jgi:hypothetical protein
MEDDETMRKLGWMALVLGVAMAAGCSSSGSKDEGSLPDVADTGADAGTDVGTDVPGTDLVTPEDVPVTADPGADTAVAETEEEASVFPDVPLADVDFASLPTLPPGKTFTTRYAAGAARKLVNPEKSVHLGGYGFCAGDENLCRNSQGIHDDISATAVAIADTVEKRIVVFVGVDSAGMIRSDIDTCHHMIQNELAAAGINFPGEQLMIGASHAHSSPDSVGIWGPSYGAGRQEWYATHLRAQIVAAAKEAVLALQDADLS